MSYRGLVCLLLVGLAWGQAVNPNTAPPAQQPPAASSTAPAAPAPAAVAPDAAVITVAGVCAGSATDAKAAASPDCKTVITRAEFERILGAISPNGVPVAARKQLATRYAMALAMADRAEKEGLDKGPRF